MVGIAWPLDPNAELQCPGLQTLHRMRAHLQIVQLGRFDPTVPHRKLGAVHKGPSQDHPIAKLTSREAAPVGQVHEDADSCLLQSLGCCACCVCEYVSLMTSTSSIIVIPFISMLTAVSRSASCRPSSSDCAEHIPSSGPPVCLWLRVSQPTKTQKGSTAVERDANVRPGMA